MQPTLTIMVASLEPRRKYLAELLEVLQPQVDAHKNEIQLMLDIDEGQVSIGAKRQRMTVAAAGRWQAFVDDDDIIADCYAEKILTALAANPDDVGFQVRRIKDGIHHGMAIHTRKYERYNTTVDAQGKPLYERTPNHLNPIRHEFCVKVGFRDRNSGEDQSFARRVRRYLKNEVFIPEELYIYRYRSPETRGYEQSNAENLNRIAA